MIVLLDTFWLRTRASNFGTRLDETIRRQAAQPSALECSLRRKCLMSIRHVEHREERTLPTDSCYAAPHTNTGVATGRACASSSASRRVRKTGQVRVLGLISARSASVRTKWRSGSARSSGSCRKKAKSAWAQRWSAGRVAHGQQAELVTAMHTGEDAAAVLEVVQAGQVAAPHQVGEELAIGEVGGDAGRDDDARAAARRQQAAIQLGEDRVGVHVAHAAQRVAPRRARRKWLSHSARRNAARYSAHTAGALACKAAIALRRASAVAAAATCELAGSLRPPKNSFSSSLMRSQGGLPRRTVNPDEWTKDRGQWVS